MKRVSLKFVFNAVTCTLALVTSFGVITASAKKVPFNSNKFKTVFSIGTDPSTGHIRISGKIESWKTLTKAQRKSTYAQIKTYKGYTYAKLNKKYAFGFKSIYAPKAKTVKVRFGTYSKGHFKQLIGWTPVKIH